MALRIHLALQYVGHVCISFASHLRCILSICGVCSFYDVLLLPQYQQPQQYQQQQFPVPGSTMFASMAAYEEPVQLLQHQTGLCYLPSPCSSPPPLPPAVISTHPYHLHAL